MNWILIGIAVIAVFLIIKYRELRHKFSFIAILLLLLFLGLSFWHVYSVNKLDISTFDGFTKAGKVYFTWLGGVFSNTKALSTYAVRQLDWGIKSSGSALTNSNLSNSTLGGSALINSTLGNSTNLTLSGK